MRGIIHGKEQSKAEATCKMNNFIAGSLQIAKYLHARGYQTYAWFFVGVATHPIIDSTSPAHRDMAVWDKGNKPSVVAHTLVETFSGMSPAAREDAVLKIIQGLN